MGVGVGCVFFMTPRGVVLSPLKGWFCLSKRVVLSPQKGGSITLQRREKTTRGNFKGGFITHLEVILPPPPPRGGRLRGS